MILAIIPARSGSKSIKNKNIVLLSDKPLISYSIKTALACKQIDKVIVSTDSPKIARIAKKYGAEVPFVRKKQLSSDETPMFLVAKDAISRFEKKDQKIDCVVLLQPTTPFRKIKDISKSLELIKQKEVDSVAGVCEAEHNPFFTMCRINNGYLDYPLIKSQKSIYSRQKAPKIYRINGALYAIKRDIVMKKEAFFTDKTKTIIMPAEYSVDIDTPMDLLFAETLIKEKIVSFS